MKHVLLKRPSFSPLHIRIFFRKVFMFERKTSCTIGFRHVLHDHIQDWKAILGSQGGPSCDTPSLQY
jgi:hypothetical protein